MGTPPAAPSQAPAAAAPAKAPANPLATVPVLATNAANAAASTNSAK